MATRYRCRGFLPTGQKVILKEIAESELDALAAFAADLRAENFDVGSINRVAAKAMSPAAKGKVYIGKKPGSAPAAKQNGKKEGKGKRGRKPKPRAEVVAADAGDSDADADE